MVCNAEGYWKIEKIFEHRPLLRLSTDCRDDYVCSRFLMVSSAPAYGAAAARLFDVGRFGFYAVPLVLQR